MMPGFVIPAQAGTHNCDDGGVRRTVPRTKIAVFITEMTSGEGALA